MSKIERFQGNVRAFASDAQGMERTVFGGTNQADDLTSQITASFLRGWGIVGASEHPSLEDFNAAMYAMSQFIAYQHQMGVAEWHAQQEYHIGSICTHNGESYQSLQDANIGNEPPSSNWTPVLTSKNGLSNLQLGEAAKVSLGVDQNYVNVTSSRQSGVVYTNSTGKPILVSVSIVSEQNKSPNTLLVNGIEVASCGVSPVAGVYSTSRSALVAVVGNGKTYQISGSGTIISWSELR